eukprot:NODE_187_length_13529_cov_1.102606.p4 type:complete len:409 gc:universal NODE_187_length_13529_cov_1.102606:8571-9797(+)
MLRLPISNVSGSDPDVKLFPLKTIVNLMEPKFSFYFIIQVLRNMFYFCVMSPVMIVNAIRVYLFNPNKSLSVSFIEQFLRLGIKLNPPGQKGAFEFVRFITSFPIHDYFTKFNSKYYHIEPMTIPVSHFISHPWLNKISAAFKGEFIHAKHLSNSNHLILYVHGGAYHFLSPQTHRSFTCKIVDETNVNMFVLDQKLAPEYEFKQSILDVIDAFVHFSNLNYKITLMGDSSGCGTLMSAVLLMKEMQIVDPFSIILLSPWLDLSSSSPSWSENLGKCFLGHPMYGLEERVTNMIAPLDVYHPYASPLYGDYSNIKVPILLQIGSDELIRDDSIRLLLNIKNDNFNLSSYRHLLKKWTKQNEKSGYIKENYEKIELQIFPDSFHFFHIFGGPFSKLAIEEIKYFLSDKL